MVAKSLPCLYKTLQKYVKKYVYPPPGELKYVIYV